MRIFILQSKELGEKSVTSHPYSGQIFSEENGIASKRK